MTPEKWEYFVISTRDTLALGAHADFDALGELGWELVAISDDRAYFKRRVAPKRGRPRKDA